MAKIAIMSDIHSNTEALCVVLQKCQELGIEQFALLGDIVGYNADPVQCIEIVRSLNIIGRVRGNHDEYAGNVEAGIEGFNENARRARRNGLYKQPLRCRAYGVLSGSFCGRSIPRNKAVLRITLT